MRLISRLTLAALLIAAPMVIVAGQASAAPDEAAISLSSTTAVVGDSVTVSGTGCAPQGPTEVNIASSTGDPVSTIPDENGGWSYEFELDTAGTTTFNATCDTYESDFAYDPVSVTVTGEPSASITDVTRAGCVISVGVQVGAAGDYSLQVWDDGVLLNETSQSLAENATTTFDFTITQAAGEEDPGIGLYIVLTQSGESPLDRVDPCEYPAAVADNCYATEGDAAAIVSVPGSGTTFTAGDSTPFAADGFDPGENVDIIIHSTPIVLAVFTADDLGAVSGTITIPVDTPAGPHQLEARGQTSGVSAFQDIFVIEPTVIIPPATSANVPTASTSVRTSGSVTAPPVVLAHTGFNVIGFAGVGLGVLAAGAGALLVGRRRGGLRSHR